MLNCQVPPDELIAFNDVRNKVSRHLKLSNNRWCMSKWKEDELTINRRKVVDEMESLWAEISATDRNTSLLPLQVCTHDNIVLTNGMKEQIDRDIGASTSTIDYCSIGTSSLAEDETHTNLAAEDSGGSYARKQFSTVGQRTRTNITKKLGMVWDDGDISAAGLDIKEAGTHWHATDTNKCDSRVAFTTFTLNAGELFVLQINTTYANGTL